MINTPHMVRDHGAGIKDLGVHPEVEVFDTGDLVLRNELVAEGLIDSRPSSSCAWASPTAHPTTRSLSLRWSTTCRPADFSAFSIGRFQMPFAAMAVLHGGNIRVGLEDNLCCPSGVTRDERPTGQQGGLAARVTEHPSAQPG